MVALAWAGTLCEGPSLHAPCSAAAGGRCGHVPPHHPATSCSYPSCSERADMMNVSKGERQG